MRCKTQKIAAVKHRDDLHAGWKDLLVELFHFGVDGRKLADEIELKVREKLAAKPVALPPEAAVDEAEETPAPAPKKKG